MRRTLLLFWFVLVAVTVSPAQSGRKAPPQPSPAPAPSPAEAGLLELKKTSKPLPPEVVDGERIYTAKTVDQRARLTYQPAPGYSREARRNKTRGIVIIRAILAADQTVKEIEVLAGLPDGLSDRAIHAAQRIKFLPAIKDGKPVSVWVEIEYRFNIY